MRKRDYQMRKFHLSGAHDFAFVSAEEIAAAVSVSVSTAYRWIKSEQVPDHVQQLLRFCILGEVPGMPGLQVIEGEIWTRSGYHVNQVELEQYGKLLPQVMAQARRVRALEAENQRLRAWLQQVQPVPRLPAPDGRADWFRWSGGGECNGARRHQSAGERG